MALSVSMTTLLNQVHRAVLRSSPPRHHIFHRRDSWCALFGIEEHTDEAVVVLDSRLVVLYVHIVSVGLHFEARDQLLESLKYEKVSLVKHGFEEPIKRLELVYFILGGKFIVFLAAYLFHVSQEQVAKYLREFVLEDLLAAKFRYHEALHYFIFKLRLVLHG